jgi:hypothetical protein
MPTTTVKVAGNRGLEVSVMFSRMKDAVAKADDRAQLLGIAGAREANNFTTHTILLHRKPECGKSAGGTDVGISSKENVKAMMPIRSWMSQSRKGVDSPRWGKPCIHPGEGDRRKRCCCTCWQWQGYWV